MDNAQDEFRKKIASRFAELPKVVQDAITSANIEKHLRELATTHKLHVDEWDALENEVTLTLLGFQRPEELEKSIQSEINISPSDARALAESINTIVFEPIRQELERQLSHPEAKDAVVSSTDAARTQILTQEKAAAVTPAPTPPVAPPATTVVRAPASGDYKPGGTSTERKSVVDDPYREAPQ